jgi:hypothetical protein
MISSRFSALVLLLILMISCSSTKEDIDQNITGRVTEKYLDMHNHGAATIVFKNSDGEFKAQIDSWVKNTDLWAFMQTGDSIIKPSGVLTLMVRKPNGESKNYAYPK